MSDQGNGEGETAAMRAFCAVVTLRPANTGAESDWLAGAGGFEPPHGGIKIRCLTTWLRPKTGGADTGAARTILAERSASNAPVRRRHIMPLENAPLGNACGQGAGWL